MELRRFNRAPINRPVLFAPPDDDVSIEGVAMDVSLGGMFIDTEYPASFGDAITVHLTFEESSEEFALPAKVRWTRADGMGVQFGLLGARETFAITEIVRRHEESSR